MRARSREAQRRGTDAASGLGAAVGYAAGTYAGSSSEIPPVVVLAASPDKLYLLTSTNAKGIILAKHLVLLATLERQNLAVELHQKVTVRTAMITDTSTGHEYKLEGKRILFHHMNAVHMNAALDAPAGSDADGAEHETAVAAD